MYIILDFATPSVLQVGTAGNYTFGLSADNDARLYVDDVPLGGKGSHGVFLTAEMHKFVVTYVEYGSSASISLTWNNGQDLPWFQVFPLPPGQPMPLTVTVNGVTAHHNCNQQTMTMTVGANATVLPLEPATVTISDSMCAFIYSTYRTPVLTCKCSCFAF